jgi:Flp pilus assembly pilin Flp
MFQELKRFYADESGPELVEWAVVTVILILATYAILTSIGEELTRIYNVILDTLRGIGGGGAAA